MNTFNNEDESSDSEESFHMSRPRVTIYEEIENLVNMSPTKRKANSKRSKVKLDDLKRMAKHLQIPTTQVKGALVDAIIARHSNNQAIEVIRAGELES